MADVLSAAQVYEIEVSLGQKKDAGKARRLSDSHEQLRGDRDALIENGASEHVNWRDVAASRLEELEQLRGERDDAQAMYRHERKFQLGQADELAAAVRAGGEAAAALRKIAEMPTLEFNPDGDEQAAWSMQLVAREALAALEPEHGTGLIVGKHPKTGDGDVVALHD